MLATPEYLSLEQSLNDGAECSHFIENVGNNVKLTQTPPFPLSPFSDHCYGNAGADMAFQDKRIGLHGMDCLRLDKSLSLNSGRKHYVLSLILSWRSLQR